MSKKIRKDIDDMKIKLYGLLKDERYKDISKMDRDEIVRTISQIDYLSEMFIREWEKQTDPLIKDLIVVFIYILLSGPEYWKKEIADFIVEKKEPISQSIN